MKWPVQAGHFIPSAPRENTRIPMTKYLIYPIPIPAISCLFYQQHQE